MSMRVSSHPVKARGKRARKDTTDDVDDDLEHDVDFKAESEQEEPQSPPRKRQRATAKSAKTSVNKKQVRGKQGRLAGFMNIPTDIFIEIASHLWPRDIIALARLNKFFRNMLMSRSSIHIWHRAMDNVPGLPDCPPDMSEPRYLALVFWKTCTSCGKAAKVEVDEVLRVRLCGPCRKTCLVPWNTVPPVIMAIIPYSRKIAPAPRRSNAYSLREDVPGLVAEYEEKQRLNNTPAFQAWAAEKREVVSNRLKHAQMLREFLGMMELVREHEIDATRVARQDEIQLRLEELGWSAEDMDFGYVGCFNQHEWLKLVSQPKPLTDRGWTTLKPKLITLLEANRNRRSQLARQKRQNERRGRLSELFRAIKKQGGFTVEITAQHPAVSLSGSTPVTASYEPPFPEVNYVLDFPVVLDLYETDRTTAEMEEKFEQHRAEIEEYISEWKARIQAHCSTLARQGPKVTKKILQSTLTASNNKSDPFANLSDDLKRLLRADSLFSTTAQFNLGRPATYGSVLRFEGLIGTHTSLWAAMAKTPPNLDGISWDAEANKAARELLASLRIPNASYLEMTDKSIYACGRCHDTKNRTWEETVYHYVLEKQQYARIQQDSGLSKAGIIYNNVHDPKLRTKLPLVKYSRTQVPEELDQYECKVCAESPALEEVITSEEKLMQHLSAVHGITNPIIDEHYTPQITEESEPSELGYYDSEDDFFDDYGYGAYGGSRYGGYGRRRYGGHHYRPRCYYDYDGGDDEDYW